MIIHWVLLVCDEARRDHIRVGFWSGALHRRSQCVLSVETKRILIIFCQIDYALPDFAQRLHLVFRAHGWVDRQRHVAQIVLETKVTRPFGKLSSQGEPRTSRRW